MAEGRGAPAYGANRPPVGTDADVELLMVALNLCVTRSRDTHTALVERIGDYVACKEAEYAAWGELWQALTDRHLTPEEFAYITSYPVPKAEEPPCQHS